MATRRGKPPPSPPSPLRPPRRTSQPPRRNSTSRRRWPRPWHNPRPPLLPPPTAKKTRDKKSCQGISPRASSSGWKRSGCGSGSSGSTPIRMATSEGGEAGGGGGGSEMMEVEETTKAAGEGEASDDAGAADAGDGPEPDGAAVAAHSSGGGPEEEATGGPVPREEEEGEEEEEEGAPEEEGNPGSDGSSVCFSHDADGVEGDVAGTTCPIATDDKNEQVLLTEEVEEETPCVFTERLTNVPLLCPHGRLHPASVSKFKLVTRAAYEGILSTVCIPPPDYHLSASNFYCSLCVKDHIGQKESNVNVSRESGELLAELEKPEPSWLPPQQQQREGTRAARGQGGGRGSGASPQVPFAISRKWVADLKVCHDQFFRNAGKSSSNSQGGGGKGKGRGGGKGRGRGGQGGGAGGEPVGAMRLPDGRVNQNITCEHGNLVGGKSGRRKYRWISPRGWEMVKNLFPLAEEVEYPAGTQPCSQCEEQDKDEMKLKLGRRQAKSAELVTGPSLKGLWKRSDALPPRLLAHSRGGSSSSSNSRQASLKARGRPGGGGTLPQHGNSCSGRESSHERYFVVEAWWMSTWRAFHDNSSIRSDPPGCLLNQAFRCDHGLVVVGERLRQLLERGQLPPAAGAAGASVLSVMSDEDGVPEAEVITEAEWLDLLRVGYVTHVDGGDDGGGGGGDDGGGGGSGGGSSSAGGAASSTSTSTAKSVLERTFGVRYSPGEGEEEGGGWFPRVCEECTKAAAERAELSKIVFEGKKVKVVRLKDGEEAPTGDGAAAQFSSTGRLKRNTRGRGAAPFEITCGSDDTVSHFKLQVFASIEVAPARQVLYLRGTELTGGSTLRAANVKAGDTLHLKVT
ncbi:unnamed protein product [Ectocarpus sp. 8 AP-2014]